MVSLVIPVFNKVELTRRCLDSVLRHSTNLREVWVVDNASSDETPQVLSEFQKSFQDQGIHFSIITNSKNLGFGSACNQGIRKARQSYIAVLNNDTWVMRGWDEALQEQVEVLGVDVLGPFFDERPFSDRQQEVAERFLKSNGVQFRKHFVPILMFFKREAVEALRFDHDGIFDERFFVTYEDTDLVHRMKQQRLKYGQTSACYIWHHSMGTRSSPGLLPEGYELEGLRIFMEKWSFDPRKQENTLFERLKRKYRKKRAEKGMF